MLSLHHRSLTASVVPLSARSWIICCAQRDFLRWRGLCVHMSPAVHGVHLWLAQGVCSLLERHIPRDTAGARHRVSCEGKWDRRSLGKAGSCSGQLLMACGSRAMCQGVRDCSYPKEVGRGVVMPPPVDSITVVMTYVGLLQMSPFYLTALLH